MRPVAVPFRLYFGIDFAAGAAGIGRLYHGLEIRCQDAEQGCIRYQRDLARDTNFDTNGGVLRGSGGVFSPMKSTLYHRQTPLKNCMVMLAVEIKGLTYQ